MLEYHTLFIHTQSLMDELHRLVLELKIRIVNKEIVNFSEIPEKIIFNCAGLGAKKLTNDPRLIPVQGHLITLKNQPIQFRYLINAKVIQKTLKGTNRDELIYFAPKDQGILGITFIRGQDSELANPHEFDRLLQRSKDFFGT